MARWKVELKCPICNLAFSSYMSMMAHIGRHAVESSSKKSSVKDDRLPSPIRGRKRSRSSNKNALMAIEAPPPPPPPTTLAISTLRSYELPDLPLKKRVLMVVRARGENQFICFVCGKSFGSSNALGGHRAHHKRIENQRRRASMQMEEGPNDNEPPKSRSSGAYRCVGCGREFSTPQGLGMHRSRGCKGPQPPAEKKTKPVRLFDLNELPPPEEDQQMLALPWHE